MKYTIQSRPHQIELSLRFPVTSLDTQADQRLQQIQTACAKVIHAQQWVVMREPKISLMGETEGLLEVLCSIDLMPSITLPERLDLKIEAAEIDLPKEQDLLERIQALQMRFGETQLSPAAAVWGDIVCMHGFGVCQGELIPLSPRAGFFMLLTQDAWASPLAKACLGAKAGQTLLHKLNLPADHPFPAWRNQPAEYTIYIESVQKLTVPPAGEIAKFVGYKTLEALLTQVDQELREENQTRWRQRLQAGLLQQLLKKSKLELPEFWVSESLTAWWQESDAAQLAQIQKQLPLAADYLTRGILNWQKPYLAQKIRRDLAFQLLLNALADRSHEDLNEQEISQVLTEVGKPLQMSSKLVWGSLQREGQAHRFLNQIRLEKASRYLLKQAQIHYGNQVLTL